MASVAEKNADRGATPILPVQLAAKITEFFGSKLALHGAVTVRLSIENWNEIFEVEETTFDVLCTGSNEQTDQHPRNYWIETK